MREKPVLILGVEPRITVPVARSLHRLGVPVAARAVAAGIGIAGATALAAPRLRIGIGTYTYHNLSIDEMIARLIALRITEIEMSRGEFMLMKPRSEERRVGKEWSSP